MHMQMPAYDTRRGSSRHRGFEGYEQADAIADRREREKALAAVRSAANREIRTESNVPSPHQVTAILADTLGLLIEDARVHAGIRRRLAECLRRAIAFRDADPDADEVRRVVLTRMRANPRLLEMEMNDRIAREVKEAMERRRKTSDMSTMEIFEDMRDDNE